MIKNLFTKFSNIDKNILYAFLFILFLTTVYSVLYNIPYLIKLGLPVKIIILFFIVSIMRDFIIWYIACLNKWIFAIFAIITFTVSGGIQYLYKYMNIGFNIGTFEMVFSTNFTEAAGVINLKLLMFFLIGFSFALFFILLRNNIKFPCITGGGKFTHSFF